MFSSLACPRCGYSNPLAAARCLDCAFYLRSPMKTVGSSTVAAAHLSSTGHISRAALPVVRLSTTDFGRLERLARMYLDPADPVRTFLLQELDRAIVMNPGDIGDDIVEVGDQVRYRSLRENHSQNRRLVFPGDLHAAEDAISVLTPAGVALLGLKESSTMPFWLRDGTPARVQVIKVA